MVVGDIVALIGFREDLGSVASEMSVVGDAVRSASDGSDICMYVDVSFSAGEPRVVILAWAATILYDEACISFALSSLGYPALTL